MIRVAAERSDGVASVKLGAVVPYVAVGIGRRSVGRSRRIAAHDAQRTVHTRNAVRHGAGIVVVVRVFRLDAALAQTDLEYGVSGVEHYVLLASISGWCLDIKLTERPWGRQREVLEKNECIVQRRRIVAP